MATACSYGPAGKGSSFPDALPRSNLAPPKGACDALPPDPTRKRRPGSGAQRLEDLPDWFGLPQAVAEFATQAADLAMISVQSGPQIIGVATVAWPQPQTMEIACMGVLRAFHGKGAGRALMTGIMALACDSGARLVLVRTLGPSDPDPHYAHTRAFYAACGFLPVAEYPQIWGPENPCLLMVLPIAAH